MLRGILAVIREGDFPMTLPGLEGGLNGSRFPDFPEILTGFGTSEMFWLAVEKCNYTIESQ